MAVKKWVNSSVFARPRGGGLRQGSGLGGLGKSRGERGEAARLESAPDRAKNAAAAGGRAQTSAAPWAAKCCAAGIRALPREECGGGR